MNADIIHPKDILFGYTLPLTYRELEARHSQPNLYEFGKEIPNEVFFEQRVATPYGAFKEIARNCTITVQEHFSQADA